MIIFLPYWLSLTEKWGDYSGHIEVASQLCCIALGWIWKASVSVGLKFVII
jgi:hypothetical protein